MKVTIITTLTTTHYIESPDQAQDLAGSLYDIVEKAIGAGAQQIHDVAIDTWFVEAVPHVEANP
jgi:hypothetical protein